MDTNLDNINILKGVIFNIINFNWFNNNQNKIKLKKDNITIKFGKENILYNLNSDVVRFNNSLKNFFETLNHNCKNFNPTLFLNLFNETLFDISDLTDKHICGNYFLDNSNSIYNISNFKAKYHELLHLASSKRVNGILQTGFAIYTDPSEITGLGITEGYTQLLAERYFNENVGKRYILEVLLTKKLELIIGKDNMEKFFFEAECKKLKNELAKYTTSEQIDDFIYDMDFITKATRLVNQCLERNIEEERDTINETINQIQITTNRVSKFLFECYKNKINLNISNNIEFTELNLSELFNFIGMNSWINKISLNSDYSIQPLNMNEYNFIYSEIRSCLDETLISKQK